MDQKPNIISPEINKDDVDDFIGRIPEVKNKADLFVREEPPPPPVNLNNNSKEFWNTQSVSESNMYTAGYAAGKHVSFDPQVRGSIFRVLTKSKINIIKEAIRSNNRSLASIKFLLDILDSLDDNIEYIIKQDGIKINEQEVLAYVHGFINSIINNKTNKELKNDRTND